MEGPPDASDPHNTPMDSPRSPSASSPSPVSRLPLDEVLPGSASVSPLRLSGKDLILTTSALPETPEILCVALSWSSDVLESPSMIQVDLRELQDQQNHPPAKGPTMLQQIVKIQAFSEEQTGVIRLICIDSFGTFLMVLLALVNCKLAPLEQRTVEILSLTDYLRDAPSVQEDVSGSELQSTMIGFLSSSVVCLALAPFIVTVDLDSKSAVIWNETQCLEDMKSRLSSFGSIFYQASDMLRGRESVVSRTPPTAALCISTTANPLLDPTFVFTLHSDTSVRKWKIDPQSSLKPLEVETVDSSASSTLKALSLSKLLPAPSTWHDGRNSVSLCARLYEHVYALTIHIKTNGAGFDEDYGSSVDQVDINPASDCRLWVVTGPQSRSAYGDVATTCNSLQVPREALSLVGMSFHPNVQRCTLGVLLQAMDDDRTTSIHVTYPPSNVGSILSTVPVFESADGSLDQTAFLEQSRIRALLFGKQILQESLENSTLEEDLHALDSMYMKYLFRPIYPRGIGVTLPPSVDCVRRALAKLAPPGSTRSEPGMSIELETLRAMYEWRSKENRQMFAMTPVRLDRRTADPVAPDTDMAMTDAIVTSPFSVYETFVHGDDNDDVMGIDDVGHAMEDSEESDQERASQVEAHENRWRRFLLQVWEEERTLRLPLCAFWMDTIEAQVVVRSGLTTVVIGKGGTSSRVGAHRQVYPWNVLDKEAMALLERIENDKEKSSQLYLIEQTVGTMISKALLSVSPLDECDQFVHDLADLGRWAWAEEEVDSPLQGITESRHLKLEDAVSNISVEELVQWSQSTPLNDAAGLSGLNLFVADNRGKSLGGQTTEIDRISWSQNQVANCQLRHAACSLSVRCIDSMRRLHLSRCLLLLDLVEGSHASGAALRSYLHSIACMWTAAQHVPMPLTALKTKRGEKVRFGGGNPDSSSPPIKRLSLGDDSSSILAPSVTTNTTALDAMIINISQSINESTSGASSPVGAALLLGESFFRLVFPLSGYGGDNSNKPCRLPELGALPPPSDDKRATDHPRLALRLLAPFVAISLPGESKERVLARRESLAECLLIESHTESRNASLQLKMRMRACKLLVPASSDTGNSVDHHMIQYAVDGLNALKSTAPPRPSNFEDLLPAVLQNIIYGETGGSTIEILRLCEMETVKSMFAPLVGSSGLDLDGVTRASITILANTLLHLSRLMHRLATLERHVGGTTSNTSSGELLLEFFHSAIEEMGIRFPGDFCRSMSEYVNLWSRLFHHAISARHWEQAYLACVSNPVAERRDSSFKRLVRAMVDSGALLELINSCKGLNSSSASKGRAGSLSIDLYEIASEFLVESSLQDLYTVRASSPEPAAVSDYQGALYSLHVSQKQWRRAAQSMNQRFLSAKRALETGSSNFIMNLGAAVLRDGLIVEDLVLAAVSSFNAVELVGDKAHRFLVSGEFGPYNLVPIDCPDKPPVDDPSTKRTRRSILKKGSHEVPVAVQDRLSNFMTAIDLHGLAIRILALRTLFFDGSSDPSYAKASFLRDLDSSERDIDELFKNGYFRYGLLLANAMSKNYEARTGSSCSEVQDLFYLSLSHMLYTYVVPVSIYGEASVENPEGDFVTLSRPSLPQLLAALDDVASSQACFVSTGRSRKRSELQSSAISAAALVLLRKLTVAHSTAKSPVALDVANFFLDQDGHYASLPTWLERLLMGSDAPSANISNGLFARRPTLGSNIYLGDPSALLTLYIKHGRLAEACDLVTSILTGVNQQQRGSESRDAKAASRLPEKGDIDFVPYSKIDVLWHLIEVSLGKGGCDKSEASRIRESQDTMEAALEKHFALMKISEMGMRSARTLLG
jgi:hypothetical protein